MSESTPENTNGCWFGHPVIKAVCRTITITLTVFLVIIAIVLFGPIILIYLTYEKLKFIGSPKECCRGGCRSCPWGDISCIRYRRSYMIWRWNHKHNHRPRVNLNVIGAFPFVESKTQGKTWRSGGQQWEQ